MQEVFENIIENLQERKRIAWDMCDGGARYDAYEKAIEIVKQEAEQYNNGWISVSERLPEESLNSVIGWDAYRERCVFVQYLQGQWKLGDWESVKITHWMNMPEKPKGE